MAFHNILGRNGETEATKFLREKGYQIVERNWKLGDLETDIIAKDGDTIVFVEVKTRSSEQWGNPEQAVDEERKRRLAIGANAYIKHNKINDPWRFDIISIIINNKGTSIRHIEEAFSPRSRYITSGSLRPERKWKTPLQRRK